MARVAWCLAVPARVGIAPGASHRTPTWGETRNRLRREAHRGLPDVRLAARFRPALSRPIMRATHTPWQDHVLRGASGRVVVADRAFIVASRVRLRGELRRRSVARRSASGESRWVDVLHHARRRAMPFNSLTAASLVPGRMGGHWADRVPVPAALRRASSTRSPCRSSRARLGCSPMWDNRED